LTDPLISGHDADQVHTHHPTTRKEPAVTADEDSFIKTIRIYEGDELVFDGRDRGSYHTIKTADDLAAFQAKLMGLTESDEDDA
jgi:hypothetical protein